MENTDPVFIENNICSIHDECIREAIRIREDLIAKEQNDHVPALDNIIRRLRNAKDRGIKMERRLRIYRFGIMSLGFSRDT